MPDFFPALHLPGNFLPVFFCGHPTYTTTTAFRTVLPWYSSACVLGVGSISALLFVATLLPLGCPCLSTI